MVAARYHCWHGSTERAPCDLPTRPVEFINFFASNDAVFGRLDRLEQAQAYLKIAQKLETSAEERKRISVHLADIRARLQRRRLNATRWPVLHEALEQDRLVRPRVVAGLAAGAEVKAGAKP